MWPIIVVASLTLAFSCWILSQPWRLTRRRRLVASRPFPPTWRDIIRWRVPYVEALPAELQVRLQRRIQVFLAEKQFVGCGGLTVTDDICVTIAAQACLLVLNRPASHYPMLHQILVYPGPFVVDRAHTDGTGIMQEHRQVLVGESWSQGQVILSWQDVVDGAAVVDDGRNVVIHEFAHQLDQETGHANGAPELGNSQRYQRWSQVLGGEFDALQECADQHQASLFSYYGATNPGEFFAVISEVFFEQAPRMAAAHPELYRELCEYYRLDPASWATDPSSGVDVDVEPAPHCT